MEFEAGRSNGACRFYKGRIDEKKWIGGDGRELEGIHTLKYKRAGNGRGPRGAPLTEKQGPWSDCDGRKFEI